MSGWPADLPGGLRAPLADCAAGRLPPAMALSRLLIAGASPEVLPRALDHALAAAPPAGRSHLEALRRLLREHPDAARRMQAVLDAVEHRPMGDDAGAALRRIAAMFDRAVAASPEASVALHSLGDARQLAAGAVEIVGWLDDLGLLGAERRALDIGCGIGRLLLPLAPRVGWAVGIDVAPAMLAEARGRLAGRGNVGLVRGAGRDLAMLADGAFDLLLAADSFPYLVQAGLAVAEAHIRDGARLLRTGGRFVILNVSYRGDLEQDRRDIARMAAATGFRVLLAGSRPFALWDGTAFVLAKES